MGISPYLRRLREAVGSDLLLVPAVMVLPRDDEGRVLLVRSVEHQQWMTIGGTIEVDEDPADAARREAAEEAGVEVELGPLIAAFGGPRFRVEYPNGDETAYVAVVYEATLRRGAVPTADGDETSDVEWFSLDELADLPVTPFTTATFEALGWLRSRP